jgi:ribosomal protein S14
MKKLIEKDKKIREDFKSLEKQNFILKFIFKNNNFLMLVRWQAFLKLQMLMSKKNSRISMSSRCLYSINKKKFNKKTLFSRHLYLKQIRSGELHGFKKISW